MDLVLALLESKVDITVVDEKNLQTPVHLACSAGHLAVVTLLLAEEARCDLDLGTSRGCSPILAATRAGQVQIVRRLADARADLDACDSELRTPLTSAFEAGQREISELLLAAHATGRREADLAPVPGPAAAPGAAPPPQAKAKASAWGSNATGAGAGATRWRVKK